MRLHFIPEDGIIATKAVAPNQPSTGPIHHDTSPFQGGQHDWPFLMALDQGFS